MDLKALKLELLERIALLEDEPRLLALTSLQRHRPLADPFGKHFSFAHPSLLLSQLPMGDFLSSRLGGPER